MERIVGEKAPAVLVHPFYSPNPDQEYMDGLTSFVREHLGPLVVMERESSFAETAGELRRLGRTGDTYFIRTMNSGIIPVDMDWPEVTDFIGSFPGRPIRVMGSYLYQSAGGWEMEDYAKPACVKEVARRLDNAGLENVILEQLTMNSL